MLRSVLAAALTTTMALLAIAGPADTLRAVGKEHDAFIAAAEREVAAMPFLKAYAYQDAAHEFCFSDVNFPALAATAMLQAGGAKTSLMKEAEQQAAAHLSGDQNASGSGHCLVKATAPKAAPGWRGSTPINARAQITREARRRHVQCRRSRCGPE